MAFRVGQKVVCVNDSNNPGCSWEGYPASRPELGAVYTVRAVGRTFEGGPGLRLDEIKLSGFNSSVPDGYFEDFFYSVTRFRHIVERKTDTGFAILTEILNGTRVPERHQV